MHPAPCKKVNIHSEGRYGFVELRTPEYASAALELNGQINLMNQALTIGRPASYVDPNKVRRSVSHCSFQVPMVQQTPGRLGAMTERVRRALTRWCVCDTASPPCCAGRLCL